MRSTDTHEQSETRDAVIKGFPPEGAQKGGPHTGEGQVVVTESDAMKITN